MGRSALPAQPGTNAVSPESTPSAMILVLMNPLPKRLATAISAILVVASSVAEQPVPLPLRAQEFPLSAVKLLDGPFRHAMETDQAYLLRLEPDRLLAGFRREAGLSKKAESLRWLGDVSRREAATHWPARRSAIT